METGSGGSRERVIVIGAGRGQRLMPLTVDQPKAFAIIRGRKIIDWIREALRGGRFEDSDITFVGGYLAEQVEVQYPRFRHVRNPGWMRNNILESLMYAEAEMGAGFVSTYADIIYRPGAVRDLMQAAGGEPITLIVDTDWRRRYRERSRHPESDAEKVRVEAGRVVELSRSIPAAEAYGEFIGVAHFTPEAAAVLRAVYRGVRASHQGRPWRNAVVFEKAYLLDMLQELVGRGVSIGHVDTRGGYFEIDTTEDFEIANRDWQLDGAQSTKDAEQPTPKRHPSSIAGRP